MKLKQQRTRIRIETRFKRDLPEIVLKVDK